MKKKKQIFTLNVRTKCDEATNIMSTESYFAHGPGVAHIQRLTEVGL